MPSPLDVEILAGPLRHDVLPVVLLVGGLVSGTVVRLGMLAHVVRLGQLVSEQDQVLRQRVPLPQPDPRLGDVGRRVEPPHLDRAVVVPDRVVLDHQVLLDLVDLGRREGTAAVGAGGVGEVGGDLGDVRVVGAEPVVRPVRPVERPHLVPRPDRRTGRRVGSGIVRVPLRSRLVPHRLVPRRLVPGRLVAGRLVAGREVVVGVAGRGVLRHPGSVTGGVGAAGGSLGSRGSALELGTQLPESALQRPDVAEVLPPPRLRRYVITLNPRIHPRPAVVSARQVFANYGGVHTPFDETNRLLQAHVILDDRVVFLRQDPLRVLHLDLHAVGALPDRLRTQVAMEPVHQLPHMVNLVL
ncbi:hypothetical protein MRQ36_21710 [Micromonospora sp. R77]|uniref:hypothetical protein n=1 Tax=Micromonospora sp. R77 TaxID=2925836 RepID=UPI001F611D5F|nr:hypothetical protein [Micromonospora sp. R77]MCI4065036.1 hypothetical protein [Micromonospora sp. R77]